LGNTLLLQIGIAFHKAPELAIKIKKRQALRLTPFNQQRIINSISKAAFFGWQKNQRPADDRDRYRLRGRAPVDENPR
jgi:hypothetical protein